VNAKQRAGPWDGESSDELRGVGPRTGVRGLFPNLFLNVYYENGKGGEKSVEMKALSRFRGVNLWDASPVILTNSPTSGK
jgi:hypothetical protein